MITVIWIVVIDPVTLNLYLLGLFSVPEQPLASVNRARK